MLCCPTDYVCRFLEKGKESGARWCVFILMIYWISTQDGLAIRVYINVQGRMALGPRWAPCVWQSVGFPASPRASGEVPVHPTVGTADPGLPDSKEYYPRYREIELCKEPLAGISFSLLLFLFFFPLPLPTFSPFCSLAWQLDRSLKHHALLLPKGRCSMPTWPLTTQLPSNPYPGSLPSYRINPS